MNTVVCAYLVFMAVLLGIAATVLIMAMVH